MKAKDVRPPAHTTVLHNTFEELGKDEPEVKDGLDKFQLLGELGHLAAQDGHVLIVNHLPVDCRDDEVYALFGYYGEVIGVQCEVLEPDVATRQALVTYRTREAADDAIKLLDGFYRFEKDFPTISVNFWKGTRFSEKTEECEELCDQPAAQSESSTVFPRPP